MVIESPVSQLASQMEDVFLHQVMIQLKPAIHSAGNSCHDYLKQIILTDEVNFHLEGSSTNITVRKTFIHRKQQASADFSQPVWLGLISLKMRPEMQWLNGIRYWNMIKASTGPYGSGRHTISAGRRGTWNNQNIGVTISRPNCIVNFRCRLLTRIVRFHSLGSF